MRRLILILLFFATMVLSAKSQDNPNEMKEEERLIEQIHYLQQLYENGDRIIDEYDESNDDGTEIELWSEEKTIAEAQKVLSKILDDRKRLYEESDSHTIAYQSRVRRWAFDMKENKSHYENVLYVLIGFNHQFQNKFEALMIRELDSSLNLGFFAPAQELLEAHIASKEPQVKEEIIKAYLPKFRGAPEELLLETNLLEIIFSDKIWRLEEKLSFDKPQPESEAEWVRLANTIVSEVKALIAKAENNKYKGIVIHRLNSLIDNHKVTLTLKSLNTATGEVELQLFALVRSDELELYRSEENRKSTTKDHLLQNFNGVKVIRTTVKDKLYKIGEYRYTLRNKTLDKPNGQIHMTYDKIHIAESQKDEDTYRLQAVSLHDGLPVEGVLVAQVINNKKLEGKTLRTDKNGFLDFPRLKGSDGYRVEIEDWRLSNTKSFYIPGKSNSSDIFLDDTQLNYFLDRPMYRRGQEVKIGLLLTENKGKKLFECPHSSIKITFKAYKGSKQEILDEVSAITNSNGIAEVSVTIPEDPDLSNYTLVSEYGQTSIRVEDYKIQYLNIEVDRIPKGYVGGQPLIIEGKTTDLSGRPTSANIILTYDDNSRIEVTSGVDGTFVIITPPVSVKNIVPRKGWQIRTFLDFSASDALGNVVNMSFPFSKLETDMPLSAQSLLSGRNQNKARFTLDSSNQPYTTRFLGDLSGRTIRAELLPVDGGAPIELEDLPIAGKKEYSLKNLKSGLYQIRLSTIDGYGKKVSDTSGEFYFYGVSDTQLYMDELFWAVKLEDGTILYGSDRTTHITSIKSANKKEFEYSYLPVESKRLYRMNASDLKGVEQLQFKAVDGLRTSSASFTLIDPEQTGQGSITLSGLEFSEEDEPILPGSHFKRTLKLSASDGKPLAKAPIIVTVFDKGVANAADNSSFWNTVQIPTTTRYYLFDVVMYDISEMSKESKSVVEEPVLSGMRSAASGLNDDFSSVAIRSNFAETAFFSALLKTDRSGEVELAFTLPDTETQYMVKVYTYEKGFEHQLLSDYYFQASSPISIDLSVPRFLTWDDQLRGEALIRNSGAKELPVSYQVLVSDGTILAEGKVIAPADGSVSVPFDLQVSAERGGEITLQAKVVSGEISDGIERSIPLISNLSTYVVATPISLYKKDAITLHPPKVQLGSSDALLELYLDPIMVILTQLAHSYRDYGFRNETLFSTIYQYNIYKRLELYLKKYPDFKALLQRRAEQLSKVISEERSGIEDRLADAKTLEDFFLFITNDEELGHQLGLMEEFIHSHSFASGGFRYNGYFDSASPFLTSYILNSLAPVWTEVKNEKLKTHLISSIPYLLRELEREDSFYWDYIDYALIANRYGIALTNLSKKSRTKYQDQVKACRLGYQRAYTSAMIRFAEYSRQYDTPEQYAEVRKFIEDRSDYTRNDDELLFLRLFLAKDQKEVDPSLIEFALKFKQSTLWHSSGVMDVAEVILDKITPSVIADNAEITINGVGYRLSPEEMASGLVRISYPHLPAEMNISWNNVRSDYIFGGVRYLVTEPSKSTTPTGEKLRVRKQIFVRQVSTGGEQQFVEVTAAHPAQKGDHLIIRYTIDTEQDLSLVLLSDPRPAASEFGYDFKGFHLSDRIWWTYSRRDTEDRIYIDYLPRGRHTLELEAIASVAGDFTYGPARIQSYYAPEFAGNSAGGGIRVDLVD